MSREQETIFLIAGDNNPQWLDKNRASKSSSLLSHLPPSTRRILPSKNMKHLSPKSTPKQSDEFIEQVEDL